MIWILVVKNHFCWSLLADIKHKYKNTHTQSLLNSPYKLSHTHRCENSLPRNLILNNVCFMLVFLYYKEYYSPQWSNNWNSFVQFDDKRHFLTVKSLVGLLILKSKIQSKAKPCAFEWNIYSHCDVASNNLARSFSSFQVKLGRDKQS